MMSDGIRINGKHSYVDFDLLIKGREVSPPAKKTIRETVPFMNGYYDFSAINGAPAWDEREVTYVFDVIGRDPADVDLMLADILDWIMTVHDAEIYDDTMGDYHFIGSYEDCDPAYDESGLAVELTVSFVCQPFKVANQPTKYALVSGSNAVVNNGHPIAPIARSAATALITIDGQSTTLIAGAETQLTAILGRGMNDVTVAGTAPVDLWFYEVIF